MGSSSYPGKEAVDLVSRLGDSLGFEATEPGLSPKRLTLIFKIGLNRQPPCPGRRREFELTSRAADWDKPDGERFLE